MFINIMSRKTKRNEEMTFIEKLKTQKMTHTLKELFKRSGYSYAQIAGALGLHPMTVSNALNGWPCSEETEAKIQELAAQIKKESVNG